MALCKTTQKVLVSSVSLNGNLMVVHKIFCKLGGHMK